MNLMNDMNQNVLFMMLLDQCITSNRNLDHIRAGLNQYMFDVYGLDVM